MYSLILFIVFLVVHGRHFNGGTISWAPIDPYNNSSSVDISITQSYAWAYPLIDCANDVPITTSGRSSQNWNLTCVVDCSTAGGYTTKPIDILTDCSFASSSLGMMNSERTHNITLSSDAHFYLANVGTAWVALNYPTESGLEWSIVTLIDLRMRPDGFINTPPAASVVSPQYAFVNTTIQINIPVSDANTGDDVRCRWAKYTAGYRRRKRSDNEEHINHQSGVQFYKKIVENKETSHIRNKRACSSGCTFKVSCSDSRCVGTSCSSNKCWSTCCNYVSSTTAASSNVTTTIDTPGTLKSTSVYPSRQAIDECGGICFPGSVPNGTTLSGCTISFTGLRANTWYAVAIQVEDFINNTSTAAMSSVPVQFLIYVLPQPTCSDAPIFLPVTSCLEVQVGVFMSFDLYAMNLCSASIATITDIVVVSGIIGMNDNGLTDSPTNSSLFYLTFTWTPQANQVGSQQLCTVAYTSERLQSNQSCITFTVKNSSDVCVTTTTTTTSTTTTVTTVTTVTTTTSQSPKTSINWPLILGLSLLALLLALCCCCCCLYWLLWSPAARRRRRRQNHKEDKRETFTKQNIFYLARKTDFTDRIFDTNTPIKDSLIDNPLAINTDMATSSPTDLRMNFVDINSSKSITNMKEKRVSVKRITHNKTANINTSETGTENIQPLNHAEIDKIPPTIRQSSVTVIALNKISTLDEPDENSNNNNDNSDINRQKIASAQSATSSKFGRISVNKIPRNSIVVSPRPKAFSAGNTSGVHSRKSSVAIQSMEEHLKTTSLATNSKTNTSSGVIVTHVSRKSAVVQAHHS